jgi:hypothetical protein
MIEQRMQSATFGQLVAELVANGNSFRFCARGRSMLPTIQDGDILHVEPVTKSPRIGDIVLFYKRGKFKAHRIIGGAGSEFITRGDAGMESDGIVRSGEIIGNVVLKECAETGHSVRLNGPHARLRFFGRKLRGSISRILRVSASTVFVAILLSMIVPFSLWGQGGAAPDGTPQIARDYNHPVV